MEGDEKYDFIHNFVDYRSYYRYVPFTGNWYYRWSNVGGVRRYHRMYDYYRVHHQTDQEN
jgi:hypothetical protein